jgi:hypothetical protein
MRFSLLPFLKRRRRALAVAALTVVLVVVVLPLALVKSHLHRIYGGYVARVDADAFALAPTPIAITDVSVLSADGASMVPGQTVIIDGGRIVAVAPDAAVPAGARTVDGRGRYLIPGLIDAHVHLRRQPNDLLLYLANGVTHVRDLAGSPADLALRGEIEQGRIGPHLTVASPLLFSAGPVDGWIGEFIGPRRNVGGPGRAEAVVRALVDDGYDAIKTYANIDLETHRAVTAAAARAGIHTVGHLPDAFPLAELASTRQRELAHIEEIVKALQREFAAQGRDDYREAFPAFVADRADAVIDDLLAQDITVNSTLWLMEVVGDQAFELEAALKRLPLEYANPAMVQGSPYTKAVGWLPGRNQFESPADLGEEERLAIQASWDARAQAHRVLTRRMVERGVRIVAGTDATSHLVIAGFSLHDELQSLVRNGMTPAQALRAATRRRRR